MIGQNAIVYFGKSPVLVKIEEVSLIQPYNFKVRVIENNAVLMIDTAVHVTTKELFAIGKV
jgi:hypothetical protein